MMAPLTGAKRNRKKGKKERASISAKYALAERATGIGGGIVRGRETICWVQKGGSASK